MTYIRRVLRLFLTTNRGTIILSKKTGSLSRLTVDAVLLLISANKREICLLVFIRFTTARSRYENGVECMYDSIAIFKLLNIFVSSSFYSIFRLLHLLSHIYK